LNELDNIPERKEILAKGYSYKRIAGSQLSHLDEHECLQRYANKKNMEFGGNIRVRWSGKPLIFFCQDESVNSQFSFGSRHGVGYSEERAFFLSLIMLV
jgi:hypothetical protein